MKVKPKHVQITQAKLHIILVITFCHKQFGLWCNYQKYSRVLWENSPKLNSGQGAALRQSMVKTKGDYRAFGLAGE